MLKPFLLKCNDLFGCIAIENPSNYNFQAFSEIIGMETEINECSTKKLSIQCAHLLFDLFIF